MPLIDKILGPRKNKIPAKVLNAPADFTQLYSYTPVFSHYDGALYEQQLIRTAIDARARHVMQLQPTIKGSARPKLMRRLKYAPNDWQTWPDFLYRLQTICDVAGTAFVVPIYDKYYEVIGIANPMVQGTPEIKEVNGELWTIFTLMDNTKAAYPLTEIFIYTNHQFQSEYFGTDNSPLLPTLELINLQNQAIEEAVKQGATIKFYGTAKPMIKDADLEKEAKRFADYNMKHSSSPFLLFPSGYENVRQAEPKSYTIKKDEMTQIETNVFNYFAVNSAILQSKATTQQLDAFYNSVIKPIAMKLSSGFTRMLFSSNERSYGASFDFTFNKLQFLPITELLQVISTSKDMGIITKNQYLELLGLPPLKEGGDEILVSLNYTNADSLAEYQGLENPGNKTEESSEAENDEENEEEKINEKTPENSGKNEE